jgi:hypothetical protein
LASPPCRSRFVPPLRVWPHPLTPSPPCGEGERLLGVRAPLTTDRTASMMRSRVSSWNTDRIDAGSIQLMRRIVLIQLLSPCLSSPLSEPRVLVPPLRMAERGSGGEANTERGSGGEANKRRGGQGEGCRSRPTLQRVASEESLLH